MRILGILCRIPFDLNQVFLIVVFLFLSPLSPVNGLESFDLPTKGIPSDTPFAGDWDGDGDDTVGLYRESTGYVFLRNNLSAGFADLEFFFGQPGDKVIASDWDSDDTDTVSIYRPSEARFYITNTNATGFAEFDFRFGILNLDPVAGLFAS